MGGLCLEAQACMSITGNIQAPPEVAEAIKTALDGKPLEIEAELTDEESWDEDKPDSEQPDSEREHISQFGLVTDIMMLLAKKYRGFKYVNTRHMNAVMSGVNLMMEDLQRGYTPSKSGEGLMAWLQSDDVGQSSAFMAWCLAASEPETSKSLGHWKYHIQRASKTIFANGEKPYPGDPGDLNRCRKLLLAVPEFAPHVAQMASEGPVWKLYVEHWQELISLLESEMGDKETWSAPKTYDRMKELQVQAEKPTTDQQTST